MLGKNFNTRSSLGRCLGVEALEPRIVLDADALPWGGDAHLTLSFAPDGTNIAGSSSALFASMNAVAPQAQWQEAILRAFQTWAVETNAAIGVVADGGQPFGISGASRNDPRFGDIRIGAAPLASGTYAIAIPADDILSGTWIGDVIFNSEATLANIADVFAVALHEAGHIFGLDHSADPLSPMHVHGLTPVTQLTPGDVTVLQQLHGQPHPDQNELDRSNDVLRDATHLDLNRAGLLAEGSAPSVVYGKLSSASDVDFFRIETPVSYAGNLSVQLRTRGISVLAPRLRILDARGDELAQVVATHFDGDVLAYTLPNVGASEKYYFVVDSTQSNVFASGDYSLVAKLDALNVVPQAIIDQAADGSLRFLPQDEIAKLFGADDDDETVHFNDDLHADDDVESGLALPPKPGFAVGTRYEHIGSIVDTSDVDFYVVNSPEFGGPVMTVRVRSLETAGLAPSIAAFDENGAPLAVRTLVNGGGELVAQVVNVPADSEIRLRVSAADVAGPFSTGNYQLIIGFGSDEIVLDSAAQGTVTPAAPRDNQSLYVALPQLFHFALKVSPAPSGNSAVLARIYNAQDQVVYQVVARPGETRSAGSALLKPGSYRVEFIGISANGAPTGDLSYSFLAHASSDLFVGDPDDPTFQPVFECPDLPGFFCYPGDFISPNPFLWDDFIASLPDPPALSPAELAGLLLGDWWTWVWAQVGVNGPPLALTDTYLHWSGAAGGAAAVRLALNVLTNDLDPEGGPMIAVLKTTTAHGALTLNADGTVDYVPEAGFSGVDTFTYTAFDFTTESPAATVRISVGLRGDSDRDGDVDGTDFLAWQRHLGSSADPAASGADYDGDGTVAAADLFAWRDNVGIAVPSVTPRGDADGDNDVDGMDFLLWQRNLGAPVTPAGAAADFDGNGLVDAADLLSWRNSFGVVLAAAAAQAEAEAVAVVAASPQTVNPLRVASTDLLGVVSVSPAVTSLRSQARRSRLTTAGVAATPNLQRAEPLAMPRTQAHDRVFSTWRTHRETGLAPRLTRPEFALHVREGL